MFLQNFPEGVKVEIPFNNKFSFKNSYFAEFLLPFYKNLWTDYQGVLENINAPQSSQNSKMLKEKKKSEVSIYFLLLKKITLSKYSESS